MTANYKILALLLLAAVFSYVMCDVIDDAEELSTGPGYGYDYYGKNNLGYGIRGSGYRSSGYARGYYGGYRGYNRGYDRYGYGARRPYVY